MGQAIPTQHPAVVLRSHYTHLRILLAIAMIAVIGLTVALVILAGNDGTRTSATPAAGSRSDSAATTLRAPARARTAPRCPTCAPRRSRTACASTADRTRAPAASSPSRRRTTATTADPKRDRAAPAARHTPANRCPCAPTKGPLMTTARRIQRDGGVPSPNSPPASSRP